MSSRWKALEELRDEDLMLRYRAGEVDAFAALLHRHEDTVFRYFLRLLKNRQGAEEATQEVFFNIIRSANSYEPKAKFTTWMFRIVYNHGVDCYRRNRLRQMPSLDERRGVTDDNDGSTMLDRVSDDGPSAEEQTIDAELHARLDEALAAINPDQREVFLMRENLGLPFEEIARMLGISTNTAKSRMRYALIGLRKLLAPRLQPPKIAGSGL